VVNPAAKPVSRIAVVTSSADADIEEIIPGEERIAPLLVVVWRVTFPL
jgi:hypothetical protein